jgi:hypothetical protein
MSRAALLARARAAAEAGMADTCTIRRRNAAADATDPNTGHITKGYVTPDLYVGKCRVQQQQAQAQQQEAGEDYTLLLRLEVQLPMTVVGLQVGDEITITAAAHDPDLPGRTFLVRDLAHKTDATARRVQVTERTD